MPGSAAYTALCEGEGAVPRLSPEQTNPAQSEVSKLEVTVLVDEQIIGFKITDGKRRQNESAVKF